MDQQEDQRRANRQVSRIQRNVQRRNMIVYRRNVVHYRVQNINGNVTITNNYYFDVNIASSNPIENPNPGGQPVALPPQPNPNPGAQYSAALPLQPNQNPGAQYPAASSQPFPLVMYGPNQNEAYSANLRGAYAAVPPISYVPPQATHIAIPLTHSPSAQIAHGFSTSPQNFNGTPPRNGYGNANAFAPRFVHVAPAPPGAMNGAAAGMVRHPLPREGSAAPIRITSPTAMVVNANGNFVTVPSSSINASTYLAIPTRINTVTYTYSNTTQRVVPPPGQILNRARITLVDNSPPVEEVGALAISEVVSSTVDDEFN